MKITAMTIAVLPMRLFRMNIPAANLVSNSHLTASLQCGERRPRSLCAIATLLILSLTGCGTIGILNSNLDQYNDGTSLDLVGSNIPGPPDGDRVQNVLPEVVVTSGGTNLMNGKKLRVAGRVDYVPTEHDVPARYQIVWRGLRDDHSSTRTHVRLQDASGRNAVVLRFEGTNLIVRTEDEAANPQPIFSETTVHEVSIIIDMRGNKSLAVEVSEAGETLFAGAGLGLLEADFSSLHAVQMESPSGVDYFVQDLKVLANYEE